MNRLIGIRRLSTLPQIKLPDLKWDYGSLEPYISGEINEIHYTKHHQTYATNFNKSIIKRQELLDKLNNINDINNPEVKKLVGNLSTIERDIKFNAGGYSNHCYFWNSLSPKDKNGGFINEDSALNKQIKEQYGDLNELIKQIKGKLAWIQGSGWVFLTKSNNNNLLNIETTVNQDTISPENSKILLAIDAWEHAYYLQYQNRKVEYFDAIWNVINWQFAQEQYDNNN